MVSAYNMLKTAWYLEKLGSRLCWYVLHVEVTLKAMGMDVTTREKIGEGGREPKAEL